jgi:hypothetical protein
MLAVDVADAVDAGDVGAGAVGALVTVGIVGVGIVPAPAVPGVPAPGVVVGVPLAWGVMLSVVVGVMVGVMVGAAVVVAVAVGVLLAGVNALVAVAVARAFASPPGVVSGCRSAGIPFALQPARQSSASAALAPHAARRLPPESLPTRPCQLLPPHPASFQLIPRLLCLPQPIHILLDPSGSHVTRRSAPRPTPPLPRPSAAVVRSVPVT